MREAPSEEDLELGRKLLEGAASPEAIAAALVRLYRAQLPDPEEVFDDRRGAEPPPREARDPRDSREPREPRERTGEPHTPLEPGSGVWFRLPVGRQNNADPKWLIPLICRRGHVTKKDIGAIRIFPRETKFEIAAEAADRFREAVRAAGKGDVAIDPAGAPGPGGPRPKPHQREREQERRGPPKGKGKPKRKP